MPLILFSKPCRYIALMAAVFPSLVSIDRGNFSAVLTGNLIVGLSVHLVEMLIPPLIAALIATESPLFLSCVLLNRCSAIFAFRYDSWNLQLRLLD